MYNYVGILGYNNIGQVGYSQELITEPTAYAISKGVISQVISQDYYATDLQKYGLSRDCNGKRGTWWWLRTPGRDGKSVCSVGNVLGCNAGAGADVSATFNRLGVRPVIWIKFD